MFETQRIVLYEKTVNNENDLKITCHEKLPVTVSFRKANKMYHTHTHTHTHYRFTALLDFVQDYPSEPAPER